MMEESIFKSCLKRKVKFTASTFVKFLITGTVALSLTACGGGGGDGGSSSSGGNGGGVIEKPSVENTELSKETLVTENQIFTNKGNVNLTENKTEDSVVGIVGKNSDILNEAEIKIDDITVSNSKIFLASDTGKDVLNELKNRGESFAIFSENGKVTNGEEGNLIIKGDSVHGIFGLYSEIANNGIIQTDGEKSKDVTGISSLGGNVTNNNLINIVSEDAVGIRVHNNTTLAGIVELEKNNGITVTNNGTIKVTGESAEGIEGNGSKINIVNNTNGLIEITNKVITGKQDRINTYGINIDSDDDVPRSSNNTVTNKGKIKINFESTTLSSEKWFNTYGIGVDTDNSTITNDGTIEINAKYGSNKVNSTVAGMRADGTNNALINNKDIIITAKAEKVPSVNENPEDNSEVYLNGILVDEIEDTQIGRPDSEKVTIENNGNIIINSENMTALRGETNGILVRGDITDVNILNTGKIEITNGKNTTGIIAQGNNINIKNKGDIILSGNGATGIDGIGENWFASPSYTGKIDIVNDGNIFMTDKGSEVPNNEFNDYDQLIGISAQGENTLATNNKSIKITGKSAIGIRIFSKAKATNNGTIEIVTDHFKFLDNMSLSQVISMTSKGMISYGGTITNGSQGIITVSGSSIGMYTGNGAGESIAINNGTINLVGKGVSADTYMTAIGMVANGGLVTNNGVIKSNIDDAGGMSTLYGNATNGKDGKIILSGKDVEGITGQGDSILKNEGLISLKGQGMIFGMDGINDEEYPGKISIENSGKIQVIGDLTDVDSEAVGISVDGSGSVATNKKGGIITAVGHNAKGMSAETGATVTNYGEINVNGEDAKGMVAEGTGSTAINEIGGVINVGKDALTGMLADGGTAINKGTINIHKENLNNDKINTDAEGNPILGSDGKNIPTSGMQAWNDGTIKNEGTINTEGDFTITTDSTSAYIIGTNKDGSYGKVSAETVTVDGNVKVSAEMAKEGYKDSYALNNAIAGKTELGKNYKLSSTSLLYNAVSKTDEEGNLDVELVRNDTDISDLASKEISKVAGIFDNAMKDKTLSEKEKEILEKVFDSTSSAKAADDTMKELIGYNVYSNIARQIFDTKDMFVSYDKSIIDSLGDYSFNFNFIGNYADVNSKNGAAGYDSKVTGINGAVRFTDSLYGVIGYGYNDIDYDGSSDGTIETIHTGIYKDIKSQFGDIRTGIFGEYNFHETDRKVFGEKADSDFNSYLIGANVEISRKFGDDLYIKPALSFDLSYGKYEDFKEDGGADVKFEKQDYISAVPVIELKLGKEFETTEVYGAVKYSYELGDLNKEQEIELFGDREDFQADNIEDVQTDVKFGASFNIKNISVNAELGKEFGKRDREYVKAGISYTF